MRDYPPTWGGTARPRLQLAAGGGIMTFGWYQNYTSVTAGYAIWNLEFVGNSADGTNPAESGFYFAGSTTDVDTCNLEIHHGIKQAFYFVTNSTLARINVRDSYIHHNRGQICAICGGADDLTVSGNTFDYIGDGNVFSHTIYFWTSPGEPRCGNGTTQVSTGYGTLCPVQRVALRNNVITNSAWGSGTGCKGVAVSMHDTFDGLTIEGNLVAEPVATPTEGCYGIAFGAGGEAIQLKGLVMRGNRVFGMGGNGIAVSGAPGALIENNLVVGGAALTTCIAYPEQRASADDLVSTGGTVRNNTCYLPSGGGGSTAIWGINEGSGHVYANNAVVTSGGSACVGTPGNGGISGGVPAGSTVAANLCSATGAGWFAAAGLDPATASFHPASASPLLGAGTTSYAPATDITGAARGSPPTVGAYEH
jgi:hypothetical protein